MGCGSSSAAQNAESHGADAGVSPDSLLVKKGAAEGTATDGQGNGAKAPADTYDEAKAIALCGAPADCAEVAHMRESGALSRLVSALNDLAVQHGKGAITLEERDSRASELASKALRDATAEVSRAVTKQASRSRAVAVGPRLEALAQSVGDGSVTAEAAREIAMRIVQGVLDDEERAKLIAGISADARAVFGFEVPPSAAPPADEPAAPAAPPAEPTPAPPAAAPAPAAADAEVEAQVVALLSAPAECAEIVHMRESGALAKLVADISALPGKVDDPQAKALAAEALRAATTAVSLASMKKQSAARAVAVGPRLQALAQALGDGTLDADAAKEQAARAVQGVLDDEERAKLLSETPAEVREALGLAL